MKLKLNFKMKKIFTKIFKILFGITILIALGVDAYYKFDVPESAPLYNLALFSYLYFCFNLSVLLLPKILKIKSLIIKFFVFLILFFIPIYIFYAYDSIPSNIIGSLALVICLISFFTVVLITLYVVFRLRRLIVVSIVLMIIGSIVVYFYLNRTEDKHTEVPKEAKFIDMISPYTLNSRYQINNVVKFLRLDLDQDGTIEIAAITSYDRFPDAVFFYAGFYRYNNITEMWDEFYSDELNILNLTILKKQPADKQEEYSKSIIDMWSKEFTTIKNIGDITRDGSPEIVFSSLIQGKYFDNNIIIAQSGLSYYQYKIFNNFKTWAKISTQDGYLIQKYFDNNFEITDIYDWDDKNSYFKLIKTKKIKVTNPEPIKIIPEMEELTG